MKKIDTKFASGKKQFGINVISNIISYAISIAISFLLTPILLNKLGESAYSFYPLSTSITNTMIIIAGALNSMASRFISINLIKKDNKNANAYFASTLFVDSIFTFVLLIVMTIFIVFIDVFLNVPTNLLASVRALFSFTFASALVNILSSVFGAATFAKNRIDLRSYREIGTSIVRLLLFLLFFLVLPPSIIYVGVITFAIAIINLVVQFIYTKKLLPEIKFSLKNISKQHIKELIISSVWVTINSVGNTLLSGMTLLMLNRFYTSEQSALVSIALTIPGFVGGIISVLFGIYFPLITKAVADDNKTELKSIIDKSQRIIGSIGCAIVVVFSSISISFFSLWVPEQNNVSLSTLSLINLLPYLFTSCNYIATYVFIAKNKVRLPAIITLAIGATNLLLQLLFGSLKINYVALPIICSALQIVWTGVFMPIYLAKINNEKWYTYFKNQLFLLGFSIIMYGICFALGEFIAINSWVKFILYGGTVGILILCLYFALISNKEIKEILNTINKRIKRGK